MDDYSKISELPNSRENGIEDQQHCEEKKIVGVQNADKTEQDSVHLQMDERFMPSTPGKISRKTHRKSDDLDASKKSWSDVQYSPYKVIKRRESERGLDLSKLQGLDSPVSINDAERGDPKGESSAAGSIKREDGTEKSPQRQFDEWEMSDGCTEPMSYDSKRKNRKRKSDPKAREIPEDLGEPSPSKKASDTEVGISVQKRRKSEKDQATQTNSENASEPEEIKAPIKIILTHVLTKDGCINYSIKKNTMDDPSARKIIMRRTEVTDPTLGSKISSTIGEEFGISSDPAKPSTSGENLVLGKKQSDAERTPRVSESPKIIPTPVPAEDCILNLSIEKNTTDDLSARKITARRTEAPDPKQPSKITSTIPEQFGISTDPAKVSTSGKNLVLSEKQFDTERASRGLAYAKMEIQRLNIYRFLKLSEKEDQIFNEEWLEKTLTIMCSQIKMNVKTFFKKNLTNTHNPTHLLSNARKLEKSLEKINDVLWGIPQLQVQDNNGGPKTLFDLLTYLNRGPLRRAIMGETFDLNKIDRIQLMKTYNSYVRRWVNIIDDYVDNRDNVYKTIEALRITVKEAVEKCEGGKKFIDRLGKSKLLRTIAVMQRSHQIGEDITRPPHIGYDVTDSFLEKVKEIYLNPVPCTEEEHALHSQISESCSDMHLSLNESRECQTQNSSGNSLEDVERAIREFLKYSDENGIAQFKLSSLGSNPNTSKYPTAQLLMDSSDVQQNSTDPIVQLNPTIGSISVQNTSTDTTLQTHFQQISPMGTIGIERNSTDKENKHFQQTPVIVYRNIEQSLTDTGSQLLTCSNDGKRQTDPNCKQNQPLGCTDVQQCSTDPNCQTTTFDEKLKMSSNPDILIQRSSELQEHEAHASVSKDQNKCEAKTSSDTYNCEPDDLSSSADSQFIEPSEQKTVTNNPESTPIKMSKEVFSDPDSPQNLITSNPIKSADVREHMDCMDSTELFEDSSRESESSGECFTEFSSSDSDVVCDKTMEIDEINDQLYLLVSEIEEFRKNLDTLVNDVYDAVTILIESKEKMYKNVLQFLNTKISDLVKKNK